LRDTDGAIVGFASTLPMEHPVLDRFIRGEISPAGTMDKDIPLFTAGATIHLYAIAVAVDPKFLVAIQHEYSAALLAGFFLSRPSRARCNHRNKHCAQSHSGRH
jgi:hypothetical protein